MSDLISNHFPPEVRDCLVRAGQAPVGTNGFKSERHRTIRNAIRKVREDYPELFRLEACDRATNPAAFSTATVLED